MAGEGRGIVSHADTIARAFRRAIYSRETHPSQITRGGRTLHGVRSYRKATQTVFGEGVAHAKILFVGEQPGDQEDLQGHPFVGPAGRILDKALVEADIARHEVYVTNAVKHFKWEPQGKRRKHKRPSAGEIAACRPWLESELHAIRPRILVCLGATAAQSVFGKMVRIQDVRGRFAETPWAPATFVTIHPSSILRQIDHAQQEMDYQRFVDDLCQVRRKLTQLDTPGNRPVSPEPSPAFTSAHTCLLIIDMINEFSFEDADKMFPAILATAERIAELKRRVKTAGLPVIYVNDNFGQWRSDFRKLVARCLEEPCRGKEITKQLHPDEDDYFVLKPKHSAFYATPLELLLSVLEHGVSS